MLLVTLLGGASMGPCVVNPSSGYVLRHALRLSADEVERVKHIGFDSGSCGCVLKATHDLPCACELAQYVHGVIPLTVLHIMWTRLSFSNISSNESQAKLCIDKETDLVFNLFTKVDIVGKLTINRSYLKLHVLLWRISFFFCLCLSFCKLNILLWRIKITCNYYAYL